MTALPTAQELPRLLHARSEHGYTDNPVHALRDEPEAVTSAYQRYLTRQAQRLAHDREREQWLELRGRVQAALNDLHAARFSVDVSRDVRAMRRTFERIDHKLTRQ